MNATDRPRYEPEPEDDDMETTNTSRENWKAISALADSVRALAPDAAAPKLDAVKAMAERALTRSPIRDATETFAALSRVALDARTLMMLVDEEVRSGEGNLEELDPTARRVLDDLRESLARLDEGAKAPTPAGPANERARTIDALDRVRNALGLDMLHTVDDVLAEIEQLRRGTVPNDAGPEVKDVPNADAGDVSPTCTNCTHEVDVIDVGHSWQQCAIALAAEKEGLTNSLVDAQRENERLNEHVNEAEARCAALAGALRPFADVGHTAYWSGRPDDEELFTVIMAGGDVVIRVVDVRKAHQVFWGMDEPGRAADAPQR